MTVTLSLFDKAQEYLAKFCDERNQGRSGKLQWDSFLLYAHKTQTQPAAVDLYAWLQEHLDNQAEVEELLQDYQRIGSILCRWDEELLAVHNRFIPANLVLQQQKLRQEIAKPPCVGSLPLGYLKAESPEENGSKLCSVPPEMRRTNPHILLLGRRHTGKSELMSQMLIHDIESADRAVVAIDSDGELTGCIDRWLESQANAEELARRIIRIDPANPEQILAYNPLEMPEDGDMRGVASAVVLAFRAIYKEPAGSHTQWNQQSANILHNSALLLMANGKTLKDLPVLLSDVAFRDLLLEKVESMKGERSEYLSLLDTWTIYKRLSKTDQWINWIEPILCRIAPALADPRIRSIMLSKSQSDLKLKDVILSKKVLLLRISREQFDHNGMLLGSLLVTGLKQAALSFWLNRQTQDKPIALYIDSLDQLIDGETIQALTDETNKLEIGLVASTRHVSIFAQYNEARVASVTSEDFCSQILTNFGSVAVFAVDKEDAQLLCAKIFPLDSTALKHGHSASTQQQLNIELLVFQEPRNYFWWLVDSVGGVLQLRSTEQHSAPGL